MRTIYFFKNAFALALFAFSAFSFQPVNAADPVVVNGIAYNLIAGASPAAAEVVALPGGVKYTGTITVQASVEIAGTTYPVKKIGNNSLRDAPNLTGVVIPDGLEVVGNSSFASCTGITQIVLPASVKSIEDWAFYGCTNLAQINIPDGVTAITEHTFQQSGLTSIQLPASVTSLKVCAFQDATKLASINLGNIREIVSWALSGTAIISATVKDVPFIGTYAFHKCPNLEMVELSGVIGTGEWAFQDCAKLSSVKLNGVESIDVGAFSGCKALSSLTIPGSVAFVGNWSLEKTGLAQIFALWEDPENSVYIEDTEDASAFGMGDGRINFTWKVPASLKDVYGDYFMGYPVEVGEVPTGIGRTKVEKANVYYANGNLNLVDLAGYDITVIGLDGRIVAYTRVKEMNGKVPVSLTSGVYLVSAVKGANKASAKFVVK
ncbi:MAG: leucine-rich repeat protein [Breznakibacter sp.]